jgi:hypothetical protein
MTSFKRPIVVAGLIMAGSVCFATPAAAQATRTWVSGVGDDANPCSRTAPCKTFAGAISKTAAGGEINCIDQGAYGAVTITKAIALNCVGVTAGVLHSSTNGIVINAAATDDIFIKGLDINGSPPTSPGLNGIRFLAGGSLVVEDTVIRSSTGAAPNGFGILFAPSGAALLVVRNSVIDNNGTASSGGGILVQPTGGGSAAVQLQHVSITSVGLGTGVRADTTGNNGPGISILIDKSQISGAVNGIVANVPAATSAVNVLLQDSVISNLPGFGLQSSGSANATIRVSNSTITLNGTGVSALNGGNVQSFGNNRLLNNTSNGAFTGSIVPVF